MEIEIYMPCRPEWVCDLLLLLFTVLAVAGLLAFILVLYREYRQINRPVARVRKKRKRNRKL